MSSTTFMIAPSSSSSSSPMPYDFNIHKVSQPHFSHYSHFDPILCHNLSPLKPYHSNSMCGTVDDCGRQLPPENLTQCLTLTAVTEWSTTVTVQLVIYKRRCVCGKYRLQKNVARRKKKVSMKGEKKGEKDTKRNYSSTVSVCIVII